MDTGRKRKSAESIPDGLVGPCKVQGRDGKVGEKKDENQTAGRYIPCSSWSSCASIVNMLIGLSRRSSRRSLCTKMGKFRKRCMSSNATVSNIMKRTFGTATKTHPCQTGHASAASSSSLFSWLGCYLFRWGGRTISQCALD